MIDSHCHLDHEPLFNDLDNIIKRSKEVGIEKLLTICTTHKSFENILKIIKKDILFLVLLAFIHMKQKIIQFQNMILLKNITNIIKLFVSVRPV